MNTRRTPYLPAAVIALFTLAVFLPALGNDFVHWDDELMVFNNYRLRSLNFAFLKWALSDLSFTLWQPAAWISHAIDYALWGLNPAGHHLTSVLLHAVDTFLAVYAVIMLLQAANRIRARERLAPILSGQAVLIAGGVTGALFGLHPQHVESAVWITGRTDLLCALFFFPSVMCYSVYASAPERGPGQSSPTPFFLHKYYLLAFAFFVLALSGKPAAITLPIVLLLLDWYPFRRIRSWNSLAQPLIEKLPFLAASLVLSWVTLAPQTASPAGARLDLSFLATQALLSVEALFRYLTQLAVPLDLLPFYPFPENMAFLSFKSLAQVLLETGITAACVVMVRKRPVLLAAWVYYLIMMLPALGIMSTRNSFMADRYTYLPNLGPFLLLGLASARLWSGISGSEHYKIARRIVIAGAIALGLVLVSLTIRQIFVWKNSVVFWSYVIEKEPYRVPVAYNNRGLAYKERGMFDSALEDYTAAIAINPEAKPYTNRGIVFAETGRLDRAMEDFNAALELDPAYADAYTSRGLVFARSKQFSRAISDFDRAIALKPESVDAFLNRGVAFEGMNRLEQAAGDYSRAIELNRDDYLAYGNRANVLEKMGRLAEAVEDFTKALSLNADDARAYLDRGACYRKMGKLLLAAGDYQKACELGNDDGCRAARMFDNP